MPELEINLDALAHNLRLIRRQEQAWGFRFLPVLKMVASHPDVVDFLRTQGYARYGIADMTEHLLYGQEPPAHIPPQSRAPPPAYLRHSRIKPDRQ